ncbi:hypothetical protein Poli38472_012422 [Pythium oligandrum]|uniref:Uncharacterized protein n=1 Tax=Pythium oligandrum TaxID=41045 RepID=A0A8K1FLM5_PYTOL|nr:hypothetical protein Poli38472_012422 [Pythium oligandrum]|eukprot:TMW67306.1 hypothetical protein Poli38472_012422 [Pythium oligandrum]
MARETQFRGSVKGSDVQQTVHPIRHCYPSIPRPSIDIQVSNGSPQPSNNTSTPQERGIQSSWKFVKRNLVKIHKTHRD